MNTFDRFARACSQRAGYEPTSLAGIELMKAIVDELEERSGQFTVDLTADYTWHASIAFDQLSLSMAEYPLDIINSHLHEMKNDLIDKALRREK